MVTRLHAGAIVVRKERAGITVYVVIGFEQHSQDYVATLIDIIEIEAAETGLVVVDAEAMGADFIVSDYALNYPFNYLDEDEVLLAPYRVPAGQSPSREPRSCLCRSRKALGLAGV